ncbi:MAG: uracil-DNA glycosylase [Gammaproteobacteria bacterium]|nr:uracil-DNA glycosylase [Gammaproteobacteria bacterium]
MTKEIQLLGSPWGQALAGIFDEPVMKELRRFLETEYQLGKIIYPKSEQVFRAFQLTPLDKVRVVFLGQDPYHGPGQAEGLCFSVPKGVPFPPSLRNLFQEMSADLQMPIPTHGSLEHWSNQGIFLLNTRLTVRAGEAFSHNHAGWTYFTDRVLRTLNAQSNPIAFVLLGNHAQAYKKVLTNAAHTLICAPHPSPLSAHRGFFGSKIFSQINVFLKEHHYEAVSWVTV